jgi:DNA transformation protein
LSADQLIAHALDLFAPLGPGVSARKMFGALGFYAGGHFFAVGDVEEGAIYLKVDEVTRGRFEAAGGRPFTYPARDGSLMVMSYLTPPDAALEDPEAMLPWAILGLEAAARAADKKVKPGAKPKTRPAAKPKLAAKPNPKLAQKPTRAGSRKSAPTARPTRKPVPAPRSGPGRKAGRPSTRRAARRR